MLDDIGLQRDASSSYKIPKRGKFGAAAGIWKGFIQHTVNTAHIPCIRKDGGTYSQKPLSGRFLLTIQKPCGDFRKLQLKGMEQKPDKEQLREMGGSEGLYYSTQLPERRL